MSGGKQCPSRRRKPCAVAVAVTSAARRDLPIPASPATRAVCPRPLFAAFINAWRATSCRVRPISTGQRTGLLSGTVMACACCNWDDTAERSGLPASGMAVVNSGLNTSPSTSAAAYVHAIFSTSFWRSRCVSRTYSSILSFESYPMICAKRWSGYVRKACRSSMNCRGESQCRACPAAE